MNSYCDMNHNSGHISQEPSSQLNCSVAFPTFKDFQLETFVGNKSL